MRNNYIFLLFLSFFIFQASDALEFVCYINSYKKLRSDERNGGAPYKLLLPKERLQHVQRFESTCGKITLNPPPPLQCNCVNALASIIESDPEIRCSLDHKFEILRATKVESLVRKKQDELRKAEIQDILYRSRQEELDKEILLLTSARIRRLSDPRITDMQDTPTKKQTQTDNAKRQIENLAKVKELRDLQETKKQAYAREIIAHRQLQTEIDNEIETLKHAKASDREAREKLACSQECLNLIHSEYQAFYSRQHSRDEACAPPEVYDDSVAQNNHALTFVCSPSISSTSHHPTPSRHPAIPRDERPCVPAEVIWDDLPPSPSSIDVEVGSDADSETSTRSLIKGEYAHPRDR